MYFVLNQDEYDNTVVTVETLREHIKIFMADSTRKMAEAGKEGNNEEVAYYSGKIDILNEIIDKFNFYEK